MSKSSSDAKKKKIPHFDKQTKLYRDGLQNQELMVHGYREMDGTLSGKKCRTKKTINLVQRKMSPIFRLVR